MAVPVARCEAESLVMAPLIWNSVFIHFLQYATHIANSVANCNASHLPIKLSKYTPRSERTCIIHLLFVFQLLGMSQSNEANADEWSDGLRWTVDLSSRAQHLSGDGASHTGYWNSIGLDANKVIAGKSSDFATVNLQLNLWCIDELSRRPAIFDDSKDCKLVSKVSTLQLAASGDGKFNILLGHAEVPYGLDFSVSTNQTLRRTPNQRDLGLKLDWGIGVNGTVSGITYATLLSRGSGMEYKNRKDPWALSGRIGTATDGEAFLGVEGFGFSWFYGDILTRTGNISERWRLAVDGVKYYGGIGFMAQLSVGETDDRETINALTELNSISRNASTVGYIQLQAFNQRSSAGWEDALSAIIGIRYTPDQNWTASLQLEKEISTFGHKAQQTILDAQLRYRF